ncbi:hypothetical protein IP88_05090 [alpha proteobacterium AAP81b]|nr:hypothetical protein IP88_05090 [alpha proteobacterium AAP81b]
MRLLLPLAFLLTAAISAPAGDVVLDRIIASANAAGPANLAFDRTTTMVKKGGPMNTRTVLVERWDGKRWHLVTFNGKPPTPEKRREVEPATRAVPVPGYYRLAALVAAATERRTDAEGRLVLIIPRLPDQAVRTDDKDISRYLSGEAVIDSAGGQPYVARLTLRSHENFKLNFLITVKHFEQVSEFAPAADGPPRLISESASSQGSLLGVPGGMKSETVFAYR